MEIRYHGHSCLEISHENYRLIIDPFLSGNPLATVKPEEIKVNYVLLTHGHNDHIGDALSILEANQATLIAPYELAVYFGKKGVDVHPMHIGGAHQFPFGRVKLTQAFHGSGYETEEGIVYLGMPAGYLLTMGNKTIYHAGDTALFGDMKLIGELNQIDAAFLPIGDNFTMGPEDALVAAKFLRAKTVVPIHFNTFPLIAQDSGEFARQLERQGIESKVMAPGETWVL